MSTEYTFPKISATSLVLVNLVPVVGVLFWGWDARFVVLLWWAEIAINWFFLVAKWFVATELDWGNLSMLDWGNLLSIANIEYAVTTILIVFSVLFFTFHAFGSFCIYAVLFGMPDDVGLLEFYFSTLPAKYFTMPGSLLTLAALMLSHGVSFCVNFIGYGEYRSPFWQDIRKVDQRIEQIMNKRMIMMLCFCIISIFLIRITNYSGSFVIVLVAIKIYVDLHGHVAERKKAIVANAPSSPGQTALMEAAMRGHTKTVLILLSNGADVNAKDEKGRTALMYAEHTGHTEIVELLKDASAEG